MGTGLTYEEFELGAIYNGQARTITETDVVRFAGLSGDFNPIQNIKYKNAVKFGDTVRLQMEVIEKRETSKPDRGIVKLAARMLNQRDEVVVDMVWTQLMKRQGGEG